MSITRNTPAPIPRILSFTPALPGWRAVYWGHETGELIFDDLAGWATVENKDGTATYTTVEACVADGGFAESIAEVDNLLGVLGPSNDQLDYFRAEALRRFEAQKARSGK